jgi:hypothetical protein
LSKSENDLSATELPIDFLSHSIAATSIRGIDYPTVAGARV